jgi:pyrroline-5-carboxylate reductase
MSATLRHGFIGAGAIAEVFVRRLVTSGASAPARITVFDLQKKARTRLVMELGVRAAAAGLQ